MIKMMDTITIKKDIFEELVKKKEEFDAIIESIELMSNLEVQKSIKKSKEDIKAGRVHKLKELL
ncbi:hypothetical protein HYX19_01870 [Candidatus Woesearchaeota archaeon]|nr:hypothetical protein [Candidatus Woesearchaeota archaeon]